MIPRSITSWEEFKQKCFSRKHLNFHFEETDTTLTVFAPDTAFLWEITLHKVDDEDDVADFDDNYRDKCNYAAGSNVSPFPVDIYECAYDATDSIIEITDDVQKIYFKILEPGLFLPGGQCIGENIELGDWFSMQIVDHDNMLGYGVDFPLKQWMKKRYLEKTGCACKTPYVGNPPQHFYIMITYTKTRTTGRSSPLNPFIVINFDLHRKVI